MTVYVFALALKNNNIGVIDEYIRNCHGFHSGDEALRVNHILKEISGVCQEWKELREEDCLDKDATFDEMYKKIRHKFLELRKS